MSIRSPAHEAFLKGKSLFGGLEEMGYQIEYDGEIPLSEIEDSLSYLEPPEKLAPEIVAALAQVTDKLIPVLARIEQMERAQALYAELCEEAVPERSCQAGPIATPASAPPPTAQIRKTTYPDPKSVAAKRVPPKTPQPQKPFPPPQALSPGLAESRDPFNKDRHIKTEDFALGYGEVLANRCSLHAYYASQFFGALVLLREHWPSKSDSETNIHSFLTENFCLLIKSSLGISHIRNLPDKFIKILCDLSPDTFSINDQGELMATGNYPDGLLVSDEHNREEFEKAVARGILAAQERINAYSSKTLSEIVMSFMKIDDDDEKFAYRTEDAGEENDDENDEDLKRAFLVTQKMLLKNILTQMLILKIQYGKNFIATNNDLASCMELLRSYPRVVERVRRNQFRAKPWWIKSSEENGYGEIFLIEESDIFETFGITGDFDSNNMANRLLIENFKAVFGAGDFPPPLSLSRLFKTLRHERMREKILARKVSASAATLEKTLRYRPRFLKKLVRVRSKRFPQIELDPNEAYYINPKLNTKLTSNAVRVVQGHEITDAERSTPSFEQGGVVIEWEDLNRVKRSIVNPSVLVTKDVFDELRAKIKGLEKMAEEAREAKKTARALKSAGLFSTKNPGKKVAGKQ